MIFLVKKTKFKEDAIFILFIYFQITNMEVVTIFEAYL